MVPLKKSIIPATECYNIIISAYDDDDDAPRNFPKQISKKFFNSK